MINFSLRKDWISLFEIEIVVISSRMKLIKKKRINWSIDFSIFSQKWKLSIHQSHYNTYISSSELMKSVYFQEIYSIFTNCKFWNIHIIGLWNIYYWNTRNAVIYFANLIKMLFWILSLYLLKKIQSFLWIWSKDPGWNIPICPEKKWNEIFY